MYFCNMIVVTGAAGFIGSCLVGKLNSLNLKNLVIVDDFSNSKKNHNLFGKFFAHKIERSSFISWFKLNACNISQVYHLGARTDTAEFDIELLNNLNVSYSKALWSLCVDNAIPFVYASSAATYGMGEIGFDDNHDIVKDLVPLNPYGDSKNSFDKWVLDQITYPPFWAGFKFFNIYGPNEYHKGRMASVVLHAFRQINSLNKMNLFRSHNSNYKDGQQLRDFMYVKDVVEVLIFMMHNKKNNGLYNLGTGKARTFNDLVCTTFKALDKESVITYIDTPIDIRDKYQYFTEANMRKLRSIGYNKEFITLECGVQDYVKNYLYDKRYY